MTRANKQAILLVTCGAAFLFPFMGSSVNVALPKIGEGLSMNAIELTWVATAFLLTSALLLVPMGRLADMRGRKRVLITGVAIYIVGSLIAAFAWTGPVLILARIVQGSSGAMFASTSVPILSSAFGPGERGKALGINAASVYSGLSLGPALGGVLTQAFGWRAVFYVNIPLGLILFFAAKHFLPHQAPSSAGVKFDLKGLGAYSVFLLGVMYGVSLLPEHVGYVFIAAGLVALGVLIQVERVSPAPLVDVRLFRRNVTFALSNVAALLNYMATYAAGFLLSLYLQLVAGLPPRTAGFVLIAMPAIQALVSPLAGRLSDRVEPRFLASLGMGLTVAALLVLSRLSAESPVVHVIVGLLVLGLGVGLFSSPNTNAVMTSVSSGTFGLAAATLSTMRQMGMVFSMGIATLVLGAMIGQVDLGLTDPNQLARAMRLIFLICSVACSVGVVASLARGQLHTTQSTQREPHR
ncbi:MAG TPA: MFS transporter [Dehalococcoidia bacterium]|nr:MFS transporter [Dehalococcoidia bacterium]